jgi:predicted nicotinamide N-methyase
MITLDFDPTPVAISAGGYPFRAYHPLNRELLLKAYPTWWWMYSWSCGIVLSWELAKLSHPKKILEVGCGLGLASVVASKLGHHITCTDVVEETEWYVGHNARSSTAKIPMWKPTNQITDTFEMVMFSDVMYANFRNPIPFVEYITERVDPDGEILCVEHNTKSVLTPVLATMEQYGWKVIEQSIVPRTQLSDAPWETDNHVLMRIKRV